LSRRLSHTLLVSILVLGTFAFAIPVSAEDEETESIRSDRYDLVLPWLPNGAATLDGEPTSYGTLLVQNLEQSYIEVDVLVGAGEYANGDPPERNWDLRSTLNLGANQSIVLEASRLGIPSGTGASIRLEPRMSTTVTHSESGEIVDIDFPARIAAAVKMSAPIPGNQGQTSSAHVRVDGYSALTIADTQSDNNAWVLPIVQNNSGWETVVRIAHLGQPDEQGSSITPVSVTLNAAAEDSAPVESRSLDLRLHPGEVASFVLSDVLEMSDWVGSAVIEAGVPIAAIAERSKSSDNMLVFNTSRPENAGVSEKFAPLVFRDYHDWNTGISVANTDPTGENEITVTYYGPSMDVIAEESLTVPPRGMNFIHSPGTSGDDDADGFAGSARVTGTSGFHAVVDQVKYARDDQGSTEAMSYVLDHQVATHQPVPEDMVDLDSAEIGTILAMPLIQRGQDESPIGDHTGIQLFNASETSTAQLEIVFYGRDGHPVNPTASQRIANPMVVMLSPLQSYTLYVPGLQPMPENFQGAAVIEITGGNGGVVAVSNNVNYDVSGDGSTAFTLSPISPDWDVYAEILCAEAGICASDDDAVEDD
jgi:hypothetical protein